MTDQRQPFRPPARVSNRYRHIENEITARPNIKENIEPFTLVITATNNGENIMDEKQFIVELAFKSQDPKQKLSPEQSQLLLSYIGEILKEIEDEESRILLDSGEDSPCL